jgi:hypothetical protein
LRSKPHEYWRPLDHTITYTIFKKKMWANTLHSVRPPVYLLSVLLLMVILPVLSIGGEHFYLHSALPLMSLVGKWFVFWGAGIRLFFAGLRQFLQPRFAAEQIFRIRSQDALPFVRELGTANLGTGIIGIA